MKTTMNIAAKRAILIFTLFLVFQIQSVTAKSPTNSGPVNSALDLSAMAPVTPKEATFDDVLPEKAPAMVTISFTVPQEATFEDDETSVEISNELLREVAPETPSEADFNDAAPEPAKDATAVKFNVPIEATFSDL